jgi:regulation of enolase protein 1 (concanavalin A-like superfamily)
MKLNEMKVRGRESGQATIDENSVVLTANGETDWFHHPAGQFRKRDVISVVSDIHEKVFAISARVSVDFNSTYDAGAIFVEVDEDNWAKLAYEYNGEKKPTIVSVVTRTTSDDADGPNHFGGEVWLRLYCDGETIAYHYSDDGKYWRFLRWFAIPGSASRPIKAGFGAQAPTGPGCSARFSDVMVSYDRIADLRDGS